MRKFRVIKIIVAFTLTVAMVLCSSVFVSAYVPFFKHDSSEWTITSDDMMSAVYPESIPNYHFNDIVYSFPEFNDETYYTSFYWNDEYYFEDHKEIIIPKFSDYSSVVFGDDLQTADKVVFQIGNNLYLACLVQGYNVVYLDKYNYFNVDYAGCQGEVNYYQLTYPYEEWTLHSYVDYYSDDAALGSLFIAGIEGPQPCHIVWSTVDVYNLDGEVIHEEDINTFFENYYTIEYANPVSVLEGSLAMEVPAESFEKISNTLSAFLFDNVGFIVGTETNFVDIDYSMTVRNEDAYLFNDTIFEYNYNSVKNELFLPVGTHALDSIVQMVDYSEVDITGSGVNIVFSFYFVTDGYNLFFPGDIEIVEYASYEDRVEHEEILNAIDNSVDKILNHTEGYEKIVFDTTPVDDLLQNQDEIVNDIYSDLDSDINNNLPNGYGDYNDYLEDNIDYFNEHLNFAFSFIKSLFEAFVDATGQSYIILFCLSFGFAIYVLGRRLS